MSSSAVKDDDKKPELGPHPADEEDDSTGGERTVAQPFTGVVDPSVPLPISIPPPAIEPPKTAGTQRMAPTPPRPPPMPAKPPPSAAMPVAKPGPRPSAPKVPVPPPPSQRMQAAPRAPSSPDGPSSARTALIQPKATDTAPLPKIAAAAAEDDFAFSDDPTDDGPTMASAPGAMEGFIEKSMVEDEEPARRSPLAATGFAPTARRPSSMSDAETVARADQLVPSSSGGEQEETTRAVSREELFRAQDAHVIVGDDAIGDEATLAVAPGDNDVAGIGAALAQTLEDNKATKPNQQLNGPAFPPPPKPFAAATAPLAAPSPLKPNIAPPPMAQQPPMPPQGQPQQQPPSWPGGPAAPPHSAPYPPMSAPHPNAPPQMMPMAPPMPQPMMQPPPAQQMMWQPQPAPRNAPFKVTPQIIALIAVGAVCLAIFVVGLYLFFTTKF
jgi:hypothetical protein